MSRILSAGHTPLAGARTSSDWSPSEIMYIFRSVFPPFSHPPGRTRVIKLLGRPPQPVHAAVVSCILHVAYAPVNCCAGAAEHRVTIASTAREKKRKKTLRPRDIGTYFISYIFCILYTYFFSIPIIFFFLIFFTSVPPLRKVNR